MPLEKKDSITFIGDDGAALTLPAFLFYREDASSGSISPVACFDPDAAISGGTWQSATAPSRQLKKNTIIIDRSCALLSGNYAENIAFVARLRNAGFEIMLCQQEPGAAKNSFIKVDENTRLYNEFGKLGCFNSDEDYVALAEKSVARNKAFPLNAESKQEVLRGLVKIPAELQYNPNNEALGDEMFGVVGYLSDEDFTNALEALNDPEWSKPCDPQAFQTFTTLATLATLKSKLSMLCACNRNQAQQILQNISESGENSLKRLLLPNDYLIAEALIMKAQIIEEDFMFKTITRFSELGKLFFKHLAANATEDEILTLLKKLKENNQKEFSYNFKLADLLTAFPNLAEQLIAGREGEIDMKALLVLLKTNPALAERIITSWEDGKFADNKHQSSFTGDFHSYANNYAPLCFAAAPQLAALLFRKMQPSVKLSCQILAYLPQEEADEKIAELLRTPLLPNCSDYSEIIKAASPTYVREIYRENFATEVLIFRLFCNTASNAISITIAMLDRLPEKALELFKSLTIIGKLSESEKGRGSAAMPGLIQSFIKHLPFNEAKELIKKQFLTVIDDYFHYKKNDFITCLAILLKNNPLEAQSLQKEYIEIVRNNPKMFCPYGQKPSDEERITKFIKALDKANSFIGDLDNSERIYQNIVIDRQEKARTFLHIPEIEAANLNDFKSKAADFKHVAVLRISWIDFIETLGEIVPLLPNLRHIVLPENMRSSFLGLLDSGKLPLQFQSVEYISRHFITQEKSAALGASADASEIGDLSKILKASAVDGPNDSPTTTSDDPNQDSEILAENLKGQGKIGGANALHDGDGVANKDDDPPQPKLDHEEAEDEMPSEPLMQKSFDKIFALSEIADEGELDSQTIRDFSKKKILVVAPSIQSHANHFLRLAKASGRAVFYIDSPDKINFDRVNLQIKDGEQNEVLISPTNQLQQFLTPQAGHPLLIIDWTKFSSKQRLALNTALDIARKIGGIEIPQNVQIIGLVDSPPKDHSFISRHDLCLKSSVIISKPKIAESEKGLQKIDLQGFPNWKRALFGRIVLVGKKMEWQKSEFVTRLENKKNNFEILNISREGAAQLRYEIEQAKAMGYIEYHGHKINISQDFNLKLSQSALDFKGLRGDIVIATKQTFQDIPKETPIINTYLFDILLQDKKIEGALYQESAGLIERSKDTSLKLFITSNLSESQWYCLFRQAEINKVNLELYLAPDVALSALQKEQFRPLVVEQKAAAPKLPNLIISNNTSEELKLLTLDNTLIIDIEDSTYQDLAEGITFEREAKGFHNFAKTSSEILSRLNKGGKVILKGKFAPDLMQFLQPLFIAQEPNFSKINLENLTIIFEDESLVAAPQEKTHPYLNWLSQGSYKVKFHAKNPDKERRANVVTEEKPDSLLIGINSKRQSDNFITQRKDTFAQNITKVNLLQLIGHSGVGKSCLMKLFEQDEDSKFKVYRNSNATNLKEWAADQTPDKTKILFIDESDIDNTNHMIFAPLKAGGNREILYQGEILKLTEHHKVVFAHNHKNYGGGRVDQKLFADGSIPEMHFADFPTCYIYEMILKKSIYDELSEEVKAKITPEIFKAHCQTLITEYQKRNSAVQGDNSNPLTVRELQEQALQFLAQKFKEKVAIEISSDNFISTDATKKAEEALESTLRIRELQRDGSFPNKAVGLNGILLEGDSGTGKSEMIQAMLNHKNICEAKIENAAPEAPHYYKIDASQTLERKKAIIIRAFEEGAIIWIDELNSCIDDGLEKILNAALTGDHPDGSKKAAKPGFMMIASVNQMSLEGRSAISPALLHRLRYQKTKSLHQYLTQDLNKIVSHWLSQINTIAEDKKQSISAAIAEDFFQLIAKPEGKNLNLRSLRHLVCENPDFLKGYLDELANPRSKKAQAALRISQGIGRRVNFKEKAEAINAFIDQELGSLDPDQRQQIDPRHKPEFLDERLIPYYTLEASKSKNFDYEALKEICQVYDQIFKFDDKTKTINVFAPINTLLKIDALIRSALITAFPQFKKEARQYDESTAEELKSAGLKKKELAEMQEMATIAGHPTVFTKAELEQALFYRQKDLKREIPPINNFGDLLQNSFCIGEHHEHKSTKRILIENMPTLKARGYETIFLEGLIYDSVEQQLLDDYFEQKTVKMKPLLKQILESIDRSNQNTGCGYLELVQGAKKSGLKVVGIESVYSITLPPPINDPADNKNKRLKDMNYAATAIIEKRSAGKKWVAIMGISHMKTIDDAVGIGDLMGVPSAYVYDSTQKMAMDARFSLQKANGVESEVRIACPAVASLAIQGLSSINNTSTIIAPQSHFIERPSPSQAADKIRPLSPIQPNSTKTPKSTSTVGNAASAVLQAFAESFVDNKENRAPGKYNLSARLRFGATDFIDSKSKIDNEISQLRRQSVLKENPVEIGVISQEIATLKQKKIQQQAETERPIITPQDLRFSSEGVFANGELKTSEETGNGKLYYANFSGLHFKEDTALAENKTTEQKIFGNANLFYANFNKCHFENVDFTQIPPRILDTIKFHRCTFTNCQAPEEFYFKSESLAMKSATTIPASPLEAPQSTEHSTIDYNFMEKPDDKKNPAKSGVELALERLRPHNSPKSPRAVNIKLNSVSPKGTLSL